MFSDTQGPNLPLLNRTTGEQLEYIATRWPNRLAVVSRHQNHRLTWGELLNTADKVAVGLAELGVHPGHRVGVWAMSCYEWVVVHFACARIGAILVSVNPASRSRELSFILEKSRMQVLFLRERDERAAYADILRDAMARTNTEVRH